MIAFQCKGFDHTKIIATELVVCVGNFGKQALILFFAISSTNESKIIVIFDLIVVPLGAGSLNEFGHQILKSVIAELLGDGRELVEDAIIVIG